MLNLSYSGCFHVKHRDAHGVTRQGRADTPTAQRKPK
jgi:hypothetical protein